MTRTKTQETAWALVELLKVACPFNEWIVVLRSPESGCEVVPVGAFHPDCEKTAKEVVAKFASQGRSEAP